MQWVRHVSRDMNATRKSSGAERVPTGRQRPEGERRSGGRPCHGAMSRWAWAADWARSAFSRWEWRGRRQRAPFHTATCPERASGGQAGGGGQAGRLPLATVIPGNSAVEVTLLGGVINFLNLYQNVLVARILLSWFPAASQVTWLQPIYTICDPFLNLFRGVLPPLGGIDFSPILGFTLLQLLTQMTAAMSTELPPELRAIRKRSRTDGASAACRPLPPLPLASRRVVYLDAPVATRHT